MSKHAFVCGAGCGTSFRPEQPGPRARPRATRSQPESAPVPPGSRAAAAGADASSAGAKAAQESLAAPAAPLGPHRGFTFCISGNHRPRRSSTTPTADEDPGGRGAEGG